MAVRGRWSFAWWLSAPLWLVAHGAAAQVEWFSKEGSSYLLAWALAQGGTDPDYLLDCEVAMWNGPRAGDPAGRQLKELCAPATPAAERPRFVANKRADGERKNARQDAMMVATGLQNTVFTGNSLRASGISETTFADRGELPSVLRGIARSEGRVYFRVPEGGDMNYRFRGTLRWTGELSNRGGYQLLWVPNTGAAGLNISSAGVPVTQVGAESVAHLEDSGRLRPGAYWIRWHANNDDFRGNSSGRVSVDLELDFEPSDCAPPQQPFPDPGYCTRADTRVVDIILRPPPPAWWELRGDQDPLDVIAASDEDDLRKVGLPSESCVVASHANPDATFGLDLVAAIRARCRDQDPVVLLACNSGRTGSDGTTMGQRLADALKKDGRRNSTVYAPNVQIKTYLTSDSAYELVGPRSVFNQIDELWRGYIPVAQPAFRKFCGR